MKTVNLREIRSKPGIFRKNSPFPPKYPVFMDFFLQSFTNLYKIEIILWTTQDRYKESTNEN